LGEEIRKLIFIRDTYLGGTLTVASDIGNPYPLGNTSNVYVARRNGNGLKTGAIVVLNNHDTERKGLWIDATPSGAPNWDGETLVNAFDQKDMVKVYADGRAYVSAPPRGYTVYVKKAELVEFK
jgi:alpha-amylase